MGKTTRLHAILVVTSSVGIGTSEELKAWGAESLAPELVPISFETMDQLAIEHGRRENERRGTTHTKQKRKMSSSPRTALTPHSKPGLDGLSALSSSAGRPTGEVQRRKSGADTFEADAVLPRGSALKPTRRKRPTRRASVILA